MKSDLKAFEETELDLTSADQNCAPIMFGACGLFLALIGLMLHVDSDAESNGGLRWQFARMAIAVYWVFPAEAIWHWFSGRRLHWQHWLALVLPVVRMGAKDHGAGKFLWLPLVGWQPAGAELEKSLHRWFSWPMIVLAILIVPLVVVEYACADALQQSPFWTLVVECLTASIWMAFVIEFVLMLSVTRNKVRYALRSWLDVIVILLPILAFLRTAQLGRLARLKDLTRTVRAYRLKSLSTRSWRAVLALDVLDRFARRDLVTYRARLEELICEKREELKVLENKLEAAERRLEEMQKAGAGLPESSRAA